ncbi:hypothetical protein JCM3765_001383 [Sporobolomyces pararoseus]
MSTATIDPNLSNGLPSTEAATTALAQLDLNTLSGPFVIGTMLAMFLQGVTLHQGGVFWLGCRKSREPIIYMVIVAVIQLMDFGHTISCVNTIYQWTVRDFGDPTALAISPWSFMIEPCMAAVTASIVHLFYAHRILLISDGHFIGKLSATFITLFTFVQLAFGSAVSSKIVTYDYQFERFIAWLWGACVWLGTLAAVDISICITYTYYLNKVAKEMSGPFVHSTQMVMKVALVVLATNGCSALVAVIATVLFGSLSGSNWHAIPQLCLEKMLTLSLLVCLNARTLLSDMIGAAPSFFHSHMKRQPLTISGNGNVLNPMGSTTVVNSGTPSRPNTARPGTGKSATATAGNGLGGGAGRFEVKIERVTTAELMRDDDDEVESSGGSSSTRDRKWKEAGFDEEIEMGHLGVR